MSVCGGLILIINNIGNLFDFQISNELITQIVDGICGVLVLFGVIETCKKDDVKSIEEDGNNKECDSEQEFNNENNKKHNDCETKNSKN